MDLQAPARAVVTWPTMEPKGFRSPHTLSRIAIALLALVLVVELANIVSSLMQLDLIKRAATEQGISAAEASDNDDRVTILARLYTGTFIASAIAFLTWFHRLYKNLSTFVTVPLKHTPGWAVGAYFVPVMNLFRPKQMMHEAWTHNAPDNQRSQTSLLDFWWVAWLFSNLASQLSSSYARDAGTSLPELTTITNIQIVTWLLIAPSAILTILVVWRQTTFQIARARGAVSEVFS